MKTLPLLALSLLLGGCAGGLRFDDSQRSVDHGSRVEFIVVHYTSSDLDESLRTLKNGGVSAHYLLPAEGDKVYRMVDEQRRAWHAGDSQWRGRTWLNASSIGIEIVNRGYTDTPHGRTWQPYPPAQIDTLIALLKDIQARHGVAPINIVGHSDIAPQRKVDPGPLFPWARLGAAGLIPWPEPATVQERLRQLDGQVPGTAWFQHQLARVGYAVPQHGELDQATRNVITAFQMKYRPARHDGQPDLHTAALLLALPD
ncbi:N-acetylmuramoyl-L-alanine amidase [Geopseudomonas guangdongensis]|uniref:N-acetylmuramoyl-L-alanine amidase n=1 Tax=Geopseudomonas guangdongensis TaxID=1245526 RepID=A0A1H2FDD0_9GAMM|nr:N-acetylmuramoyl-L-alanine amidase [Pseudomonas guangdongensis]SDU05377.1 N-acetylmuramoyl-L-alanine amidase [Pseudomonas guangdongensis]